MCRTQETTEGHIFVSLAFSINMTLHSFFLLTSRQPQWD